MRYWIDYVDIFCEYLWISEKFVSKPWALFFLQIQRYLGRLKKYFHMLKWIDFDSDQIIII